MGKRARDTGDMVTPMGDTGMLTEVMDTLTGATGTLMEVTVMPTGIMVTHMKDMAMAILMNTLTATDSLLASQSSPLIIWIQCGRKGILRVQLKK